MQGLIRNPSSPQKEAVEAMLEKPPKEIPKGHILYEDTLIEDTFTEMLGRVVISPDLGHLRSDFFQ